jgi:hypothetical protein
MLTQRLRTNQATQEGTLTIECQPGGLAELIGLADELALRASVTTEGAIHTLNDPAGNAPEATPPPPVE